MCYVCVHNYSKALPPWNSEVTQMIKSLVSFISVILVRTFWDFKVLIKWFYRLLFLETNWNRVHLKINSDSDSERERWEEALHASWFQSSEMDFWLILNDYSFSEQQILYKKGKMQTTLSLTLSNYAENNGQSPFWFDFGVSNEIAGTPSDSKATWTFNTHPGVLQRSVSLPIFPLSLNKLENYDREN